MTNEDRPFAEVYYLAPDQLYRIWPAWLDDGTEIDYREAISRPSEVYERLVGDVQQESGGRHVIAYHGWPEIVLYIGGAMASGVVGNAAYDLLKIAVNQAQEIAKNLAEGSQEIHLSERDANRLALAIVRAWSAEEGRRKSVRTITMMRRPNGSWVVLVHSAGVLYEVDIPPGPLDGARIRIRRGDGRSVAKKIFDFVRGRAYYAWLSIRYR